MRQMMYVGAGANDQQFRRTPKLPSHAGGIAFYTTQDADPTPLRSGEDRCEGEEGRFFVQTPDEIRELLDNQASPLPSGGDGRGGAEDFMAAHDMAQQGNASTGSAHGFEGKTILEFVGDTEQCPTLAEARRAVRGAGGAGAPGARQRKSAFPALGHLQPAAQQPTDLCRLSVTELECGKEMLIDRFLRQRRSVALHG
jgi:hypothetical protein